MLDRIRSSFVLGPQFTAASLTDVLAKAHGDRPAVTLDSVLPYEGFSGTSLTGRQIHELVTRMASVLGTAAGVRCGERVVVCASGRFDELLAVLAIFRLGAVAVPLSPETDAGHLVRILSDERGALLVTDRAVWDRALDGRDGAGPVPCKLAFLGPAASVPEAALSLDAAIARGSDRPDPATTAGQDTIAIFRGHDPAAPARTVLTAEGLTARGRPLALIQLKRGAVGIVALPLTELLGFSSAIAALLAGVTLHHVACFDAERVLETMERRRAAAFFGTPRMYRAMIDVGLDGHDLRSVRLWGSATERMPVELIGEFKRRGAMFSVGRWRTEAIFVDGHGTPELPGAAVLRFSPPGIWRLDESVVGIPIPPFRAKVCDDAGHEVARGEIGEIWIQGPDLAEQASSGAARSITTDGWHRTGELATQDFLGLLHFAAGRPSVIHSGGYAVLPTQIEQALASHPAVGTVVAFGLPHPTRREMPVAVVAPREGVDVEPDALLAWGRERLADHKAPRRIWIVSPHDLSTRGDREALRAALRERYAGTFTS